jgi:hypothetical protein
MKADQFRKLLIAAGQMQRDSGNAEAAQALTDIASLLPERGTMTVAVFATQVAKAAAGETPA